MLRCLIAPALSLLLVAPLTAQTTPDCTSGRARGAWDLPVRDQPGIVRGVLGDGAGHRLALQGRLTPATLDGGLNGGRIEGLLTPLTPNGLGMRPIAAVHGTYVLGRDGRGRFEAVIVELEPRSGDVPRVLGKLAGAFADPMRDKLDPIGRFAGQWALCR